MRQAGPELRLVAAGRLGGVLLLCRFVLLLLGVHHFYRLVLLGVATRVLRRLLSWRVLHAEHVVLPAVCSRVSAVDVLRVRGALIRLVETVGGAQRWRLVHQADLVLHLLDVDRVHVHVASSVVAELGVVQVIHVTRGGSDVELLLILSLAVRAPVLSTYSWPEWILVSSILLLDLHVPVLVFLARGRPVDDGVAHRLCVPGRLGVAATHGSVRVGK